MQILCQMYQYLIKTQIYSACHQFISQIPRHSAAMTALLQFSRGDVLQQAPLQQTGSYTARASVAY